MADEKPVKVVKDKKVQGEDTAVSVVRTTSEKSKKEKIIEIKNLVKQFGKETVVDDVNLNIRRGEFVTLLGPSGCGKTTILRMIAGFENPTSGAIMLDGNDISKLPPYKRPVNTVFQKYALFPHLNVFNNIAYGLKLKVLSTTEEERQTKKYKNKKTRKFTKEEIESKVNAALKLVNLENYGKRDVESLSGGQQQRVAIARALVNEPRVLLLDEPLGALDLKMRKEMQLELRRMHRELGITFIYVTHDQEEALHMSDTVVVISDGKIQQVGSPKEIYDDPANAFVADFIGESNIIGGTIVSEGKVNILGKTFEHTDKGFTKNQPVDVVIRPEDIELLPLKSTRIMMKGRVVSSIFLGTYYEMGVMASEYELTVQATKGQEIGSEVGIAIKPEFIHIMKRDSIANIFETTMWNSDVVEISRAPFSVANNDMFEKGDEVIAEIAFDKVEIMDDEREGTVGANVTATIYKGTFYQVQLWTDNDIPFTVYTPDEYDIGDRVGLRVRPEDVILKPITNQDEQSKLSEVGA